jgi:hypothetical protein
MAAAAASGPIPFSSYRHNLEIEGSSLQVHFDVFAVFPDLLNSDLSR